MNTGELTLMWPDRERELAEYLGPYTPPVEDACEGHEFCPLCGEEIRFGQHWAEGPNGYLLHERCYAVALHAAVEEDEDVSDPRGEWLSDAIADAIIAREEQYNTDKFPQLWNSKI